MSNMIKQRELSAIRAVRNVLAEGKNLLGRFLIAPDTTEFLKAANDWKHWREEMMVSSITKVSSEGGGHPDTMISCRDDSSEETKRGTKHLKGLLSRQLEFNDFGLIRIGLKQIDIRRQQSTAKFIEDLMNDLMRYGPGKSKSAREFILRYKEPSQLNAILARIESAINSIDFILTDESWLHGLECDLSKSIKKRGNRHSSESSNPKRRCKANFYAIVRQYKQPREGSKQLSERLNSMKDIVEAAKEAGIEQITEKTVEAAIEDGRRLVKKQKPPTK